MNKPKEIQRLEEIYRIGLREAPEKKFSKKKFPSTLRNAYALNENGGITHLDLSGNGIREIKGLDALADLQWLDLSVNEICEIKGLDALADLQWLDLSSNRPDAIKGLDALVNLQSLNMSASWIREIKGLDALVDLQSLDLCHNRIKEIKGLDALVDLRELNLQSNEMRAIKGLDALVDLQSLNISINGIREIKGLDALVDLRELNLACNKINEIKGLDALAELKELLLQDNKINEIKGLDALVNLRSLKLSMNNIKEVKNLDAFSNMQVLHLSCNQIDEIKGLDALVKLKELRLQENQIDEIRGLETLRNMRCLYLSCNQIDEIKGLDALVNLQELDLACNKIKEIKGLETLVKLKGLWLQENRISEIKGLDALVNLKNVDLSDNCMKFETDYFEIESHRIEWGKTRKDVRDALKGAEVCYYGDDNPIYEVSKILKLDANRVRVYALFDDRPVSSLEYEIAPLERIRSRKFYTAYIDRLKETLGEPSETEIEYEFALNDLPHLDPMYRQGCSICKAIWRIEDFEITLRVFGETRDSDGGDHAADLEIEWMNEQKAAEPYLEQQRLFEKSIGESINEETASAVYALGRDQSSFQRSYSYARRFITFPETDREFLDMQMVLTRPGMFHTPKTVSDRLTAKEISLSKTHKGLMVANKWNAVCLDREALPAIGSYKVVPGDDRYELCIGSLIIQDYDDSTIRKIVKAIEAETGAAVEVVEYYDDGH